MCEILSRTDDISAGVPSVKEIMALFVSLVRVRLDK